MRGTVAKRLRKKVGKGASNVEYEDYKTPTYGRVGDGIVKMEGGVPRIMKKDCGRRFYKVLKELYGGGLALTN